MLKFSRQSRQPLRLQAHKPIAIATYIPKFELHSSNFFKARDPDHEKNERVKLQNQIKQERKGAIRELRKDSRFLAGVQRKEQKEKDAMYSDKMRKVHGSIESERAEEKAMEREKSKDKRRAGKK
jgi:nucleolar protein 14